MVNPWSASARGSKIPDDDSSRSVAITVTDTFSVTTNAGGNQAVYIRPCLAGSHALSSSITNYVPAWAPADNIVDYTAVSGAFSKYRIVSWGYRFITTESALSSKGRVRIITADQTTAVSLAGGLFETVTDYALSQADIAWVSRPLGVNWKEYIDIDAIHSWDYGLILITGANASTYVASIEVVYNLECIVELGTVTGAIATPAADHHPLALTAADHVRNKTAHSGNAPSFFGQLWSAAKSGILTAAQAYASPLLGGVARSLLRLAAPKAPLMLTNVPEVD